MAVINKITKAVKKVDTSGFGNPRANPIGPKILKSKPIMIVKFRLVILTN